MLTDLKKCHFNIVENFAFYQRGKPIIDKLFQFAVVSHKVLCQIYTENKKSNGHNSGGREALKSRGKGGKPSWGGGA